MKNLQDIALIQTTNKLSVEFTPISFKEALDLLIEISREQTEAIHEIKKELLSSWRNISKKTTENN